MGYAFGTRWTDDLIKTEIQNVMKTLCISRMPSSVEIEKVTGNSKLTNAIRRHKGYKFWADKLGIEQSNCTTRTGYNAEIDVLKIISSKGYKVEKMTCRHPYDLLLNDCIKVDVKASHIYKSVNGYEYYSFNLEKKNPTCDIYIVVCIEENKILVIPSKFLNQTQLSIGIKSKYDKFIDRWDYIEKFNEFYSSII